jgi:putative chitinase
MLKGLAKIASKTAEVGIDIVRGLLHGRKVPGRLENSESSGVPQQANEILGSIYKLMVQARQEELERRDDMEKEQKDSIRKENDRNDAIIKALSVKRKKPTPKKDKEQREKDKQDKKQQTQQQQQKTTEKKTETKQETQQKKQDQEVKKTETKQQTQQKKQDQEVKKTETKQTAEKQKEVVKQKKVEEVKPEAPKPTAEKAPPVKEAPQAPKPTATKTPTPGKGAAGVAITGGVGLVISALTAAGLSQKAQANILAQVEAESKFVPQSENLNYSADGLANTWPNRFGQKDDSGKLKKDEKSGRILPNQLALQIQRNPEKIANTVYGNRKDLGNNAEGDGFKYRGRGFIQITGKDAYQSLGDYLKLNLVSNPDLLNDPVIAAKSIPWFFLNFKKKKPKDLENIGTVNSAVGFQNKKLKSGEMESDHRAKLAEKYSLGVPSNQALPASLPSTGSQIDQSSKENKDLKDAASAKKSVNVNTTNVTQSSVKQSQGLPDEPYDDRNPHQKKK